MTARTEWYPAVSGIDTFTALRDGYHCIWVSGDKPGLVALEVFPGRGSSEVTTHMPVRRCIILPFPLLMATTMEEGGGQFSFFTPSGVAGELVANPLVPAVYTRHWTVEIYLMRGETVACYNATLGLCTYAGEEPVKVTAGLIV